MKNNEKIICMCMDVTEKEIINSIKNENCKTVDKVGNKTGAGTVCGGCRGIIKRLAEEYGQSII